MDFSDKEMRLAKKIHDASMKCSEEISPRSTKRFEFDIKVKFDINYCGKAAFANQNGCIAVRVNRQCMLNKSYEKLINHGIKI